MDSSLGFLKNLRFLSRRDLVESLETRRTSFPKIRFPPGIQMFRYMTSYIFPGREMNKYGGFRPGYCSFAFELFPGSGRLSRSRSFITRKPSAYSGGLEPPEGFPDPRFMATAAFFASPAAHSLIRPDGSHPFNWLA
jgi:hypothetical protein